MLSRIQTHGPKLSKYDLVLLKERVRGSVTFHYLRDEMLYYKCDDGFVFKLPVGVFRVLHACEPGVNMMSWIYRQMLSDVVQELQYERMRQDAVERWRRRRGTGIGGRCG